MLTNNNFYQKKNCVRSLQYNSIYVKYNTPSTVSCPNTSHLPLISYITHTHTHYISDADDCDGAKLKRVHSMWKGCHWYSEKFLLLLLHK